MTQVLACLLVGICLALPASASIKDYPFRLDTRQSGREHVLSAINDGPAFITIAAQIQGSNVASDRDWPMVDVIPPHSSRRLARVFAANPAEGYKFNTRYSHGFGNSKKTPDAEFRYRLPLGDGTKTVVGQAPGGEITTHTGPDSLYAVDFSVAENTPVVAARDGTVIDVADNFTRGGEEADLLERANVVTLLHDDGSMASYVHLAPHSTKVKLGDKVSAGQMLAYSGNTGYSTGPHLHFAVTKATVRKNGVVASESIPTTFVAFNPPRVFTAEQNMSLVVDYQQPGNPSADTLGRPTIATTKAIASSDTALSEPDTLVIEGRHDTSYWMDEIERRTGYPGWAWIAGPICIFILLALLLELYGTFQVHESRNRAL